MRAGATIKSGNVTHTESAPGDTINNGNAGGGQGLEEIEAKLYGLMGTKGADRNDPAEVAKREARMRRFYAKKDGGMCAKCGGDLGPQEPVYIACVWAGYLPLGGYSRRYAPTCAGCAPSTMKGEGPRYAPRLDRCERLPCDTCERPVVWRPTRRDYYRRHVFCCERCQWTYHNGARNARNARAREKVCEVCEEPFTAARRDAKTCSPACKQKAYRRRKGAA